MRRSIANRQNWKQLGLKHSMRIYRKLLHERKKYNRWGWHWADQMLAYCDLGYQRETFLYRRKMKQINRRKNHGKD